jgi:hypothetical protein
MSFPVRRPDKPSFRIRRNFKSRDWTSIGLRGARAARKASNRQTAALPGCALKDDSRVVGFDAPASKPSPTSAALSEKDRRGLLWTALIIIAIAAAAIHVMQ